jgi:hypothetical protein
MRLARRGAVALVALICLAAAGRLTRPAAPVAPAPATFPFPTRPATPFERLLRQAWKLRSRALRAEIDERDTLETWDQDGSPGVDPSTLRSEALARDRSGDLRLAHRAAQAAAALARTPAETHRVGVLLQLIDRELGDPQAEPALLRSRHRTPP